ncbi:UPF0565 protein C2orf69 like protein [Argiope bruennichi]|uniref:UPF0565 protein C2orf69 like protein n=1 Tax=Argiope bruennichi TaxID=94029 RepID=A0A8T0FVY8_ARGBR|nr:UPF0565 protein C2orf69 like protein [Argiope bruennichi]
MTGISRIWKNILCFASMAVSIAGRPIKLGKVDGYQNRSNDIIYYPSVSHSPVGCVVFFGGDMQDYEENMLAHRDNKHYSKWNLEFTAELLHKRFPQQEVIIVKPSKMSLMTFSCYENFVTVNNFGAPTYEKNVDALKHLRLLLANIGPVLQRKSCEIKSETCDANLSMPKPLNLSEIPLIIIGFSKGCVVLNQFLYSFHALHQYEDHELELFVNNITDIYWLEGGHSGSSSTWVTDKTVLQSFANLKKNVHIHVTPYQVYCDTRPRIGKEEKIFRDTLSKMGANITRKLHFEDECRSLDKHFEVLEVFKEPT